MDSLELDVGPRRWASFSSRWRARSFLRFAVSPSSGSLAEVFCLAVETDVCSEDGGLVDYLMLQQGVRKHDVLLLSP